LAGEEAWMKRYLGILKWGVSGKLVSFPLFGKWYWVFP
jgi:hypothetical protein